MSSTWSGGFVLRPVVLGRSERLVAAAVYEYRLGMAKKLWTAQANTFCSVETSMVTAFTLFSLDPCASLLSRCSIWDLTVSHRQKELRKLRQHGGWTRKLCEDCTSWMHVEGRMERRRQGLRVFLCDLDVHGLFLVCADQLAEEKDL